LTIPAGRLEVSLSGMLDSTKFVVLLGLSYYEQKCIGKKTGQMNGEEKDVSFIFIKNDF
jgi:hypothetical protein